MVNKLKITLYSTNSTIRNAIRTAFKGARYDVLEITDSSKMPQKGIKEKQQPGTFGRLVLPKKVDFVVSTSGLDRKSEGLARDLALSQKRNDVFVIVLPEAMDYLRRKLDQYGELVLVGADQAK